MLIIGYVFYLASDEQPTASLSAPGSEPTGTQQVTVADVVSESAFESEINEYRVKEGRAPLQTSERLRESACEKADDMLRRDYWAHYAPDGSGDPYVFMREAGFDYQVAGENLYYDRGKPLIPAASWMLSPGHRENMLAAEYQYQGICLREGKFQGQGHVYLVVQHLATPLGQPVQ